MDRIKFFQDAIIDILKDNAAYYKGTTNPLNLLVISDKENNHFQLLMQGWRDKDYTFQCLIHLDIIDEKIWIQWNNTACEIEIELLKKGVAADEIVIGLKSPEFRIYTDFAVA